MENTNKTQDFDMLASIGSFFRSIRKGIVLFFTYLGKFLYWVLNIHIRYFFLFLIVYAICLLLGARERKSTSTTCSAEATVYCNGFDNFMLDRIVNQINEMIYNSEYEYLSRETGLTSDECRLIRKLELGIGIDTDNDGLTNDIIFTAGDKFKADKYEKPQLLKTRESGEKMERYPKAVKISDMAFLRIGIAGDSPETLLKISDSIIAYINSMPHIQTLYRSYMENLDYSLRVYDNQIRTLDSLQKKDLRRTETPSRKDYALLSLVASNNNLTGKEMKSLTDPSPVYYEDIIKLMEERSRINQRIQMANAPVSILSDFNPLSRSVSKKWIGPALLQALCIAVALGFLLDFHKAIWQHICNERRPLRKNRREN